MVYLIALVALITLVLFVQKVIMKSRLERGLGRQVKDHELTSLKSWMQTGPEEPPKNQPSSHIQLVNSLHLV